MIPKFRAWDRLTGKMFPVVVIDWTIQSVYIKQPNGLYSKRSFDEVKLMQSTGGSDKYDNEIFEGDIVGEKDDASTYGVVTYDPDRLMFRVYGKDFDDALSDYWDCEIIGNIYENPELVEVENE